MYKIFFSLEISLIEKYKYYWSDFFPVLFLTNQHPISLLWRKNEVYSRSNIKLYCRYYTYIFQCWRFTKTLRPSSFFKTHEIKVLPLPLSVLPLSFSYFFFIPQSFFKTCFSPFFIQAMRDTAANKKGRLRIYQLLLTISVFIPNFFPFFWVTFHGKLYCCFVFHSDYPFYGLYSRPTTFSY